MVLLIAAVGGVTAAIYWTGTQTVEQTAVMVGTGEVETTPITLSDVDEMTTDKTFDASTDACLDEALTVKTGKPSKDLRVTVEDTSALTAYSSWTFKVIVGDTVPAGETTLTTGETLLTVTAMETPTSATLTTAGVWTFDYEFTVSVGDLDEDKSAEFVITFEVV